MSDDRDLADDHVVTRYRLPNSNLRAQLFRRLAAAGLTRWPRLFHNLRASCQTDLAERFPSHVVGNWIGNSDAGARDHYPQTTDAHFAGASGVAAAPTPPMATTAAVDADSDAATGGVEPHPAAAVDLLMLKTREILQVAKWCDLVRLRKWAGTARRRRSAGEARPDGRARKDRPRLGRDGVRRRAVPARRGRASADGTV